jgi:hypothetical protein
MLTMRIVTAQGETVQLKVKQAEFVLECPHCKLMGRTITEFRTINPDQIYCTTSHRVAYWRKTHVTAS